MSVLNEILKLVIAGGAMFCLHDTLQSALINYKTTYGRAGGYMSATLFTFLLICYFGISGILVEPHFINYLFIPAIYALGPNTYLLFVTSVNSQHRHSWLQGLRYLPALLLTTGLPVAYYFHLYDLTPHPLAYFRGNALRLVDVLFIGALIQNVIYYFLIFRKSKYIFDIRAARNQRSAYIFITVFIITSLIGCLALLAFPLRDEYLLYWACFLVGLLVIASSLLIRKYPELSEQFELAIQRAAYKNSQLGDLDIEVLSEQIAELMEAEKVYTDAALSLASLAELLDLKPYQLTEYLNVYQNTNFARFINKYRIEAAAHMLTSGKKVNILRTAFQVGFNSKATFNLAFRRIMGCSPTEYIRQQKRPPVD